MMLLKSSGSRCGKHWEFTKLVQIWIFCAEFVFATKKIRQSAADGALQECLLKGI